MTSIIIIMLMVSAHYDLINFDTLIIATILIFIVQSLHDIKLILVELPNKQWNIPIDHDYSDSSDA